VQVYLHFFLIWGLDGYGQSQVKVPSIPHTADWRVRRASELVWNVQRKKLVPLPSIKFWIDKPVA
jgi:hypothetical protein